MRVVVQTGDYDEAVKLARQLKVYPLGQSGDESSYEIVDVRVNPAPLPMLAWEKTLDYWRQLHAVVDEETVQDERRFMLGLLEAIGIRKGEPFEPDARTEALLLEAARTGWSD